MLFSICQKKVVSTSIMSVFSYRGKKLNLCPEQASRFPRIQYFNIIYAILDKKSSCFRKKLPFSAVPDRIKVLYVFFCNSFDQKRSFFGSLLFCDKIKRPGKCLSETCQPRWKPQKDLFSGPAQHLSSPDCPLPCICIFAVKERLLRGFSGLSGKGRPGRSHANRETRRR